MNYALILVFLLISCSQLKLGQRIPANSGQSNEDIQRRILELGRVHILDYLPQEADKYDLETWNRDLEATYSILGQVDRNLVKGVPSKISGRKKHFARFFLLDKAKQIPFDEWLEMGNEVVDAYLSGHHVFKKDDKLYSVWGIALDESHIHEVIYRRYQRFPSDISKADFLNYFFNRYHLVQVKNNLYYELPYWRLTSSLYFQRDKRDWAKQEMPEERDLEDIVNHSNKRTQFTLDDYENYFAQKYSYHRVGMEFPDYDRACPVKVYIPGLSRLKKARLFLETLIKEKAQLMKELNISNNTYNEFLATAMGILLVESKMGKSLKYFIKEGARLGPLNLGQWGISLAKKFRGREDENSRGLTQIKDIGPYLKDTSYEYLNQADLHRPENAAIATMFVLREKYGYLNHFKNRHSNINDNNWSDYIYYFYQGASRQITKGLATPHLNLRIQKILQLKDEMILLQDCY